MLKFAYTVLAFLSAFSLTVKVGRGTSGYSLDNTSLQPRLSLDLTQDTTQLLLLNNGSQEYAFDCPVWHYYSPSDRKCKCYESKDIDFIKCSSTVDNSQQAMLQYGYCMSQLRTAAGHIAYYVALCPCFQQHKLSIKEKATGFMLLPDNASQLDSYMCGPMKRKGFLCSQCIDSFSPSFTSLGYQCSNCTQAWYGFPLYIMAELTPATMFYLIILVFQIKLTSSPMTAFLFYSQLIMFELTIDRNSQIAQLNLYIPYQLMILPFTLYGMWNLDFLRYIIPPFCISDKLTTTHVALLGYVSVVYPLFLMVITWILVELHDHNFHPIVFLWKPFHRCFVHLRRGWNSKSDIIDVFASFLLLSYSKLMYQSILLVDCPSILIAESGKIHMGNIADTDVSITCKSSSHLKVAIPAGLVIGLCSLPVFLLTFYPIKPFRRLLSKLKLDHSSVNMFVDKFYSCYKDGTNVGRDFRSFSGLYFVLRITSCMYVITQTYFGILVWSFEALLFTIVALLIAFFKPYKKTYMNVIEILLLINLVVLCLILSSGHSKIHAIQVFIVSLIPGVGFWAYAFYKIVFKVGMRIKRYCSCKKQLLSNESDDEEVLQPDQISIERPLYSINTSYGAA